MVNAPNCQTISVNRKRRSGEGCTSLFFRVDLQAVPGQFVMVWAPGVDEVPMSLSHIGAGEIGITVKEVGEATSALCSMQKGDRARIRGPFGRGFSLKGRRPLIVAGGVGSAPLLPLARSLAEKGTRATIIIGAKTKGELILFDEFKETGLEIMPASDDGSIGHHGTASDLLAQTLGGIGNYDAVYACGPEQMLVSIVKIANKRSLWGEAALERLMKCGVGLCGSCAINQKLVCRDGPVFDFSELRGLPDFGCVKRDSAGRARVLTGV